ncbi:GNAT family N-acetyltransferase [Terribacillus sp. 7520-G]|uniref:GNAT family N-acetyltransferase n=1 Tax=Terribacillus sp. 7520-G TaxID=2025389 RepID=UPI000BA4F5C2|nr:GNAT family N-acetyltransferase [Terribacillus sp. 7520-G]PAD40398.1 hypothetical protein CHH53_00140 [Terribacillus sp. 7520-G]
MNKLLANLKYYSTLAIKKPRLISSALYKKHLGLILSFDIRKTQTLNHNDKYSVAVSSDIQDIYDFYKRMNRNSISVSIIKDWLSRDYECFLIKDDCKNTLGAMWAFKNEFLLKNTSGRTLSSNKEIKLDKDTVYGAYVIIDPTTRGKGLNHQLLGYVINYYDKKYKKLLVTTGASNAAYIRSSMKNNAQLIGIVEVLNILGFHKRKIFFIDSKEKVWH